MPFPESGGAVNTYPIAVAQRVDERRCRAEFVDLVTGPEGQEVLAAAGFAAP